MMKHCPRRVVIVVLTGLALAACPPAQALDLWPFSSSSSSAAAPGTPKWWKKHKDKAEHVPGKGYRVPGFEGYYDGKGRPINAPVDEVVTSLTPDDKSDALLPGIDPKRGIENVKSAVGMGPNEQVARQALTEGEALFQAKEYDEAADKFELAAERWPNSLVEARALFLLGECYFWQDEYIEARDTYDQLVSKHPNTRHLDTLVGRQWEIAQYWEKYHLDYKAHRPLTPNLTDRTRPTWDTLGHAIKTYDSIRLNDPTGPWADDAIMATAGIYFRQQRYTDADYHYTLLRKDYPRSEHQFNAHLLGLQAKLRKYRGADYDGSPLEEAKQLLKQITTQFAGQLSDKEKERLRLVRAEVAKAVEERDLRMARYYDKTSHYGAARYYYAQLAEEGGASPLAQQARERLAEISDKPAVPEQRLAWLVDLFPESAERSRVNQVPELRADSQTRMAENPPSTAGDGPSSTR